MKVVATESGVKMKTPKLLKRIPLPFSVDPNPRDSVPGKLCFILEFYQVSKLLIATAVHPDLSWYLPVLGSKLTAPKK